MVSEGPHLGLELLDALAVPILDEQLRNVKDTFFQVTGRRAQSLPIVEVE